MVVVLKDYIEQPNSTGNIMHFIHTNRQKQRAYQISCILFAISLHFLFIELSVHQ